MPGGARTAGAGQRTYGHGRLSIFCPGGNLLRLESAGGGGLLAATVATDSESLAADRFAADRTSAADDGRVCRWKSIWRAAGSASGRRPGAAQGVSEPPLLGIDDPGALLAISRQPGCGRRLGQTDDA